MAYRPPIHVLVFAPAGSGKSYFAATFPKPMLVLGFDPLSKMMRPYLRRGIPSPEIMGDVGQGMIRVESKKTPGKLLIQVELFHDDQLDADGDLNPTAYPRYLGRMPSLYEEVRAGMWRTVVVDTVQAMKLASRNLHQFKLNKKDKDDRRFDKLATDDLEQALCCRMTTLRCNVVLLTHVAKDKDEVAGIMVGQPAVPGRLASSDGLPAKYPELYSIRTKRDPADRTKIIRKLQTQPDERYNCMSVQIDAPDAVDPDYKNLWENFDAEETA